MAANASRPGLALQARVELASYGNCQGVVRFIGQTQFATGQWVGVRLDEAVGKNDGSVGGIPYFDDCPPFCGVFVRPSQVHALPAHEQAPAPASPESIEEEQDEEDDEALKAAAFAEVEKVGEEEFDPRATIRAKPSFARPALSGATSPSKLAPPRAGVSSPRAIATPVSSIAINSFVEHTLKLLLAGTDPGAWRRATAVVPILGISRKLLASWLCFATCSVSSEAAGKPQHPISGKNHARDAEISASSLGSNDTSLSSAIGSVEQTCFGRVTLIRGQRCCGCCTSLAQSCNRRDTCPSVDGAEAWCYCGDSRSRRRGGAQHARRGASSSPACRVCAAVHAADRDGRGA